MTLHQLNSLGGTERATLLHQCCGSRKWVEQMNALFPIETLEKLLNQSEMVWSECNEADWKEAFSHHPKIGDLHSLKERFAETSHWASDEQSGVKQSTPQVIEALAKQNEAYVKKFGYIFIVCASGMSAEEMLSLLTLRLLNSPEDEITIAMEEQNKITMLRLTKLLS